MEVFAYLPIQQGNFGIDGDSYPLAAIFNELL